MPDKWTASEFAQQIKEKYPAYKDWSDEDLTKAMVEKFPQYKDQVDMGVSVPTATLAGGYRSAATNGMSEEDYNRQPSQVESGVKGLLEHAAHPQTTGDMLNLIVPSALPLARAKDAASTIRGAGRAVENVGEALRPASIPVAAVDAMTRGNPIEAAAVAAGPPAAAWIGRTMQKVGDLIHNPHAVPKVAPAVEDVGKAHGISVTPPMSDVEFEAAFGRKSGSPISVRHPAESVETPSIPDIYPTEDEWKRIAMENVLGRDQETGTVVRPPSAAGLYIGRSPKAGFHVTSEPMIEPVASHAPSAPEPVFKIGERPERFNSITPEAPAPAAPESSLPKTLSKRPKSALGGNMTESDVAEMGRILQDNPGISPEDVIAKVLEARKARATMYRSQGELDALMKRRDTMPN